MDTKKHKNPVGRPKSSYKWSIDGKPVTAQAYYKYKRAINRNIVNKLENQYINNTLKELISIRDKIEVLIKVQLSNSA